MVPSPKRESRVTGHLSVKKGRTGQRKYFAHWIDRNGVRRTTTLGGAHVEDSGRRTARGAVIWRAGDGRCPAGSLTPKDAGAALRAILEDARAAPRPRAVEAFELSEPSAPIPTFGDAVDAWLNYLRVEKRRKRSTLDDAKYVAEGHLLPRFGRDTPLYRLEHHEVVIADGDRQRVEVRQERRDTFTTRDVDEFRRELLAGSISPRSAQKVLVLLHGVFKLAKRRGLIESNPSTDAERVTLDDAGTFNVLEPVEFEAVYRAALGQLDERPEADRDLDVINELGNDDRFRYAAALSVAFYAGPRMGEIRDLPWRNVDFARSMIRIESGFTRGERSTPKGERARSTPLVPVLAERLTNLGARSRFVRGDDYVFANSLGDRMSEDALRAVFYAALARAGLGGKRAVHDFHGNPQMPIRVHDLRHSWCTWAVNVWPITKVQTYAGHRDIKTTMRYVHHQTKAEDASLGGQYLERVLAAGALAPASVPAGR
jgi:integrase